MDKHAPPSSFIPLKPKLNLPKFFFILLLLAAAGIAGIIFIRQPFNFLPSKKITAPPTPAPGKSPLPMEKFARSEGQKATYYSNYFKKTVTINNAPEFMAIPTSLSVYIDLVNAVVVKVIDSNHFIVETYETTIPIVIQKNTQLARLQQKPDTKPDNPKNFTVKIQLPPINLSEQIKELDLLTFNLESTASASAGISGWRKDKDNYNIAGNILIYEKK